MREDRGHEVTTALPNSSSREKDLRNSEDEMLEFQKRTTSASFRKRETVRRYLVKLTNSTLS